MFGGAALAFLISGYGLLLVAIFRMVIYLVAGWRSRLLRSGASQFAPEPRLRPTARQTAPLLPDILAQKIYCGKA